MKSESDIEQRHRQDAIASGWMVVKIMRASPSGFPDRLYFKDARTVVIEWKRPDGGVLSAQQKLRIKELRNRRIEVYVIDNIDEANRVLGIGYASKDLSERDL
jgi:hypothetical protein